MQLAMVIFLRVLLTQCPDNIILGDQVAFSLLIWARCITIVRMFHQVAWGGSAPQIIAAGLVPSGFRIPGIPTGPGFLTLTLTRWNLGFKCLSSCYHWQRSGLRLGSSIMGLGGTK